MADTFNCDALKKQVNELEKLLDLAPDLIFRMDRELRLMFVNQRVLEATGLSREQYLGRTNRELQMPEELCDLWDETILAVFRDRKSRDVEFTFPSVKGPICYQMRVVPEEAPDGTVPTVVGITRDITKRKEREEILKSSEERFRTMFTNAPLGMFRSTFEGRFLEVNPALALMLGYDSPESVIHSVTSIADQIFVRADKREKMILVQINEKGITHHVNQYRRRDGSVFTANLYLKTVFDARDKPVCLEGIVEDVTERKKTEESLKKAHDELEIRVAERTAELAWRNRELMEFTSVASHDLQEPLRKIKMFGEILQHELPENLSNSAQDCLSRMTDAANRMEALIRALLAYSRVSSKVSPFKRIDLKEIAEKVNEDLEVSMGQKHPVVKIGDLPAIDGDPIQIAQLLQNLIGNAIRYSKDDQVPVVKISGRETHGTGEGKERWLELRVEDNGIGFDMCYLDKIFMPFERLHGRGQYEGTGMGLAICRKIAERHGGAITAQSRPGEGATFVVTLPMRQAVPEGEKNA